MLIAAAALSVATCGPTRPYSVRVVPGSTAQRVTLEVRPTPPGWLTCWRGEPAPPLHRVAVYTCGAWDRAAPTGTAPEPEWSAEATNTAATARFRPPWRVTYGVAPPGFTADRGPRPLRPGGCYDVRVEGWAYNALGAGSAGFRVAADGTVRQLSLAEHMRATDPGVPLEGDAPGDAPRPAPPRSAAER